MKGFFGWHVAASSHPSVSSLEMLKCCLHPVPWGSTHDEAEVPWDIARHSLHAHDCSVTPSSNVPQPMSHNDTAWYAYVWLLSAGVEARKSVLATARSIQSYKGRVFMRTWTLLSRRWSPRTSIGMPLCRMPSFHMRILHQGHTRHSLNICKQLVPSSVSPTKWQPLMGHTHPWVEGKLSNIAVLASLPFCSGAVLGIF